MLKMFILASAAVLAPSHANTQVNSGREVWGPAPPGLPSGAQAAVLAGDPTKPGLFVIRAKFPAGYKVPPHWHPTDEHVTVISGDFALGMGDKIDPASAAKLSAGSFITAKATMHHFATSSGGAVVQISAEGPFVITYVNPSDDPRRK